MTDHELERLTGEPHVDGWPLYSGLPPAEEPHDDHACLGICCPKRGECQRYQDAEGMPDVSIDSCQRGNTWPMFIQRKEAEE